MIKGKVVAITGASAGIGRATAHRLAAQGARLVLGSRSKPALDELAEKIRADGGEAIAATTDVTRREDLTALVATAESTYGRLDVLVNNAGIGLVSAMDKVQVEEWEQMVDVNLKGVLYGIAAALPVFRRQGDGQFVTIGSTAGIAPTPTMTVYGATKNAVATVCDGLRTEAGPDLRVTLIRPGFVATEFTDKITDEGLRGTLSEARDAMAITPDAIAATVAFAIDQSREVDVNDIIVRPTSQQA